MRTTIRLDDSLLREAKARAAGAGRSLNAFIEDAVRSALRREADVAEVPEIPRFPGGRLRPGVSLDSGAELLELMERGEPGP